MCDSCTQTGSYRHTDTNMHTGQRGPGLPPCRWPQLPRTAWSSPPHTLTDTSICIGPCLLCTHWVHGPAPGSGQAPLLVPRGWTLGAGPGPGAGDEHGQEEGAQQESQGGSASASRRRAGSTEALLAGSLLAHLAEQRQWWLLLHPSLLPRGRASPMSVRNLPKRTGPVGWQPEGSTGDSPGRAAKPQVAAGGRMERVWTVS